MREPEYLILCGCSNWCSCWWWYRNRYRPKPRYIRVIDLVCINEIEPSCFFRARGCLFWRLLLLLLYCCSSWLSILIWFLIIILSFRRSIRWLWSIVSIISRSWRLCLCKGVCVSLEWLRLWILWNSWILLLYLLLLLPLLESLWLCSTFRRLFLSRIISKTRMLLFCCCWLM